MTPPPGRLGRLATVVAGLSLGAYLVAAILLAIPVETPKVQRCGVPAAYLLAGRVDRIPDDEDRIRASNGDIVTLDDDVAAEARSTPCRDRVADRAVPAAILLVVATVLGLIAFAVELFVVRPRQRRAVRRASLPPAGPEVGPSPPPPPPPPPSTPARSPWGDPPTASGG